MLTVNIQLPEPELSAIIQKRCAEFGTVKFIRLMPIAKNALHRFAFVQMSTLAETMDLASAAGGSTREERLKAKQKEEQKPIVVEIYTPKSR